jgi:hypothetical protein
MADSIPYRKLPGSRRGMFFGSSVWMGPDHLLLVKSQRFQEEYKRFYFRDVQAIAVADAPRFHISARAVAIAALWLMAFGYCLLPGRASYSVNGFAYHPRIAAAPWMWLIAAALVAAWAFISAKGSCVCRLYTAVSADPLPSVYRRWTAKKFLALVEPRIREAQAALEGGWEDAVAGRQVGPEVARLPVRAPLSLFGAAPLAEAPRPEGRRRSVACFVFLAALLGEVALEAATLASAIPAALWIMMGLLAAQTAAAVFVFFQRYRGTLRPGMEKVALAKLVWMLALLYINMISAGVQGATRGQTAMVDQGAAWLAPTGSVLATADAMVAFALCAVGAVMTLRLDAPEPPSLRVT